MTSYKWIAIVTAILTLAGAAVCWAADADQPPPSQAAPVAQAEAMAKPSLQVAEAAICQAVTDRRPVGTGDVFAKETERLYCFTRIVGAGEPTQVTHNWYHEGSLKASVVLPVKSPNWRTWSSKTLDPAWTGEWMVEILSADGKALESIIFYLK